MPCTRSNDFQDFSRPSEVHRLPSASTDASQSGQVHSENYFSQSRQLHLLVLTSFILYVFNSDLSHSDHLFNPRLLELFAKREEYI